MNHVNWDYAKSLLKDISPEILTGLRSVDSVIPQTFVKNFLCARHCLMCPGYISEYNKYLWSPVAYVLLGGNRWEVASVIISKSYSMLENEKCYEKRK